MNVASNVLKNAVHQHPLHSIQGVQQRLFSAWFNSFIYNQIWEDPQVDIEALQLNTQSRVLTIASGGCNILSYLTANPARIIAIDLNPYHMSLTRLKLAAIEHLPTHEMLYDFFGTAQHSENQTRYETYIRPHINSELDQFWYSRNWRGKRRLDFFEKGFYRYTRFGYFVRLLHFLGHRAGCQPEKILEAKTLAEQETLFDKYIAPVFDTFLMKTLARLPYSVFSLGIPPQQYRAMKRDGNLIEQYLERIKRLACQFPIQNNYFAWQAFSMSYDHDNRQAIPDYLQEQNFEPLRERLSRVETHITTLTHYLEDQADNTLDRFVFLDSLDWMRDAALEQLWQQVARVAKPGSRIIFRTAAADSPIETALSPELRERFVYEEQTSKQLFQQDRSAIYGGFHLYCLKA
jgi:S-adenosylmethionine-diacylglycerol 3-amino-3-carboxypropyl transferase